MKFAYPHIAGRLFDRPLAIEPVRFKTILDRLGDRIVIGADDDGNNRAEDGEVFEMPTNAQRLAAIVGGTQVLVNDGMGEYCLTESGVAVVPVLGPLAQRWDWFSAMCGFCTYDGLRMILNHAFESSAVKAILLDVDSPGGEAHGMFDIADHIMKNRDVKPIWGCANGLAASAAYGLIGATSRITTPRMAYVGSIGVVTVHADYSEADKMDGVKYTAIYSGKRKIDGWAHAPLSKDAKDNLQADLDDARDMFAALVGSQGRVTQQQALETEAEVYRDEAAVEAKLSDAVLNFDETLAELELAVNRSASGTLGTYPSNAVATEEKPMATKAKKADGKKSASKAVEQAEQPADDKTVNGGEDTEDETVQGADTPVDDTEVDDTENTEASTSLAAIQAENTRMREIMELCAVAGMPEMALTLTADKNCTVADARKRLIKARADNGGRLTDMNTNHQSAPVQKAVSDSWAGAHAKAARMYGMK